MGADPQQLLDLAALCGRGAVALQSANHEVVRCASEIRWQGPAADRFHDELASERRSITAITDRLQTIRSALLRHAAWVEERHAALRRLETRIRSWAMAHPAGSTVPGPTAAIIGHYPAPLDAEWEALARRLRSAGAVF